MNAFPLISPTRTRDCPSIAAIKLAVSETFGVPILEMTSERRSRYCARPRQVAMFLARDLTPFSLPNIGRFFGNRDHTTVIHAVRVIERCIADDADMAGKVEAVRVRLGR